jgi:transcriptional regulator with XRE-family HTH domain
MKERLKRLRKFLGLTQGDFGKRIGMADTSISHMEAGRPPVNDQNLKLICLTFGVREAWLRDGTGEMMDDEALLSDQERQLLDLFRQLSPKARVIVIEYVEKVISDERALRGEAETAGTGEKAG